MTSWSDSSPSSSIGRQSLKAAWCTGRGCSRREWHAERYPARGHGSGRGTATGPARGARACHARCTRSIVRRRVRCRRVPVVLPGVAGPDDAVGRTVLRSGAGDLVPAVDPFCHLAWNGSADLELHELSGWDQLDVADVRPTRGLPALAVDSDAGAD